MILRLIFFCLLAHLTLAVEPPTHQLCGKLVVPAQAGTKASFRSGDFQLLTKDARVILSPSKQVSEQQLLRFKDQFVTVKAEFVPERQAAPEEQAPMDPLAPDGQTVLQAHPAHYRVVGVEAYHDKPFPVYQR